MSRRSVLLELIGTLDQYGVEADPQDAKARTRARILRTATELFEERGYRRTTVDEVARRAHVAKGTVYLHFESKAMLMFHAIAEEKKRFVGSFIPMFRDDPPGSEWLERYLARLMLNIANAPLIGKMMRGDRELFLFMEELSPEKQAEVASQQELGMEVLLENVGSFDELPPQEQKKRMAALQAIFYALPQLMDARGATDMSPEEFARTIARVIVRGIAAP